MRNRAEPKTTCRAAPARPEEFSPKILRGRVQRIFTENSLPAGGEAKNFLRKFFAPRDIAQHWPGQGG
jgi:hypothetical protein